MTVKRGRPQFDWWDDAVEVACSIAATTGVRQRVYYVSGSPRPWRVAPAILRLVEVPC